MPAPLAGPAKGGWTAGPFCGKSLVFTAACAPPAASVTDCRNPVKASFWDSTRSDGPIILKNQTRSGCRSQAPRSRVAPLSAAVPAKSASTNCPAGAARFCTWPARSAAVIGGRLTWARQRLMFARSSPPVPGKDTTDTSAVAPAAPGTRKLPWRMPLAGCVCHPAGAVQLMAGEPDGAAASGAGACAASGSFGTR